MTETFQLVPSKANPNDRNVVMNYSNGVSATIGRISASAVRGHLLLFVAETVENDAGRVGRVVREHAFRDLVPVTGAGIKQDVIDAAGRMVGEVLAVENQAAYTVLTHRRTGESEGYFTAMPKFIKPVWSSVWYDFDCERPEEIVIPAEL